jgi:1-hydroxycarotenoid 3,4-desaturase
MFLRFCDQAKHLLATLRQPYMGSQRPTLLSMTRGLGPRGLAALTALGPFSTLWRALSRHFEDPRLQQLFGRYATYCGSSPFKAPATMMLIAQVEMEGVWSVRGGMHSIAQALAERARALGVDIRCMSQAQRIELRHGAVHAVHLLDGTSFSADAVVFNGESHALAAGLLGDQVKPATPAVSADRRSLSALTWAMHAPTSGFNLARHNVFFDADYASEFRDIFEHRRLPRQATVYVCAQDRPQPQQAPSLSSERLLCLVNAPAYGDGPRPSPGEIYSCEQAMLRLLARCGLQIRPQPEHILRTAPHQFHNLFPGSAGALYGQATHSWMDVFKRPAASTAIPGLFLAGGSAHPGAGVPMAAISGQLAAAALMAHLDSTSRSRTVATFGGTSMPSAMTDSTASP